MNKQLTVGIILMMTFGLVGANGIFLTQAWSNPDPELKSNKKASNVGAL